MKYTLSVPTDRQAILISFAEEFQSAEVPLAVDHPLITNLQKRLKLAEFIPLGVSDRLGYDGALFVHLNDGIFTCEAALPERIIGTCPICDGKGEHNRLLELTSCSYCGGAGETPLRDYTSLHKVCASLSILFWWLGDYTRESPMEIVTMVRPGMNGFSMSLSLGNKFCAWLEEVSTDKFREFGYVKVAMIQAYQWMSSYQSYDLQKIDAGTRVGKLVLECPGDRTGLYSSGGLNELHSHNLDNSVQQLTLLVGLARLQDEFRRDR